MRKFLMVTAATAAVATLGALSPATAGAADHALRIGTETAGRTGQAPPGARLWFRRYNGPQHGLDMATSMAVSRTGRQVFVTGLSQDGGPGGYDYATVAYSAATGRQVWVRRYVSRYAWGAAMVAVSRTRVFVTGTILRRYSSHAATVAYSAATGRQLWVRRREFAYSASAGSIMVNAAGTTVFVVDSGGTLAYSAGSGRQLWFQRSLSGAVVLNPSGTTLFAASGSAPIAYSAATGAQLWVGKAPPGTSVVMAESVTMNATGTALFVTGSSENGHYGTAAYSAATGAQLWASYYAAPGDAGDAASSIAVNPAGTTVFVTGQRTVPAEYGFNGAYSTVAYDAATGSQLWVRSATGATSDEQDGDYYTPSVAVSPNGDTVYFTGSINGYKTIAYNAATGATRWARHHPGTGTDHAATIAVDRRGDEVFVTGTSSSDYGTVAYRR
jgi:outer membrane protein assembly factor BamB